LGDLILGMDGQPQATARGMAGLEMLNESPDSRRPQTAVLKPLVNEKMIQPKVVATVRPVAQAKESDHRTLVIEAVRVNRLATGLNIRFG
jgi:hypothetical protein